MLLQQALLNQVQVGQMIAAPTQPMFVCVPGSNGIGQVMMPVMIQQQLQLPNLVAQVPQVGIVPCVAPSFQGVQGGFQTVPGLQGSIMTSKIDECDSDSERVSRRISNNTITALSDDAVSTTSKDTIDVVPPLKSTSATPVSGLAGAIAKRIREHGVVDVIASGVDGSNQAVKAMALARTFLVQEGKMISVQPEQADDCGGIHIKFHCEGILNAEKECGDERKLDVIIRVSANSVIRKTAGAIAKLIRGPGNSGQTIGILTMGAESVAITAQAVTTARTMLEQDYLDITFNPKFIHVNDERSLQPKPALQLALKVIRK